MPSDVTSLAYFCKYETWNHELYNTVNVHKEIIRVLVKFS
jgi:hypothetical protein